MVQKTVNGSNQAATRQGVLFHALESREDCFIFQAVSSQGKPAPYKSITYCTVLWVMFHYSVFFSKVGCTQGCKGQAVLVAVADGFIIGTCVDFTISKWVHFFKKYVHDTTPLDECSITACISTAHSAVWLSLVAHNTQNLTLTPSRSSSTLSTPI